MNPNHLQQLLQTHFGYDRFRPLQEEIIRDTLAGRDVLALLPTGGGKSLCYQLPALAHDGLTLVISPLISLMKDQVDALTVGGIPATFINSTLDLPTLRRRQQELDAGQHRLLYIAPERLPQPEFQERLRRWRVNRIAVDEAHCISEWGHDFRPDYRQIRELRTLLPDVPVLALTATATERVRADIATQLQLRAPGIYIASFNRPNLTYTVQPKQQPYRQLLALVQGRPRESGIVYCQSRKTAETLAERLTLDGVAARPYHAGLDAETRTANQEAFLRDEARVVCATIAFGMGINKSNVRFIIHHDLPKNIEGYYQETGRAGRDGLPGECTLLFSPGDAVKIRKFIAEKPDPRDQEIARDQLRQMLHYAESRTCRRAHLLRYFGEAFPDDNCGGCDNCLAPREAYDGTRPAHKLLSCVYRLRQATPRLGVGLNHIAEVLTGARTAKIQAWGHDRVSTYGIGQELARPAWQAVGHELLQLGLLRQTDERFATVELTPEGLATLRGRQPVTLTRLPLADSATTAASAATTARRRAGDIACDEVLFERLRTLRRRLADDRNVPAYVIFSDLTLRELARRYPASAAEFATVPGVGQSKHAEFAKPFLAEIAAFLETQPRQSAAGSC
ncbi:MAG: DNA helicase RecQ [Lentisphaeria bacterium]|jgi:ATP-dependent DNA helicase RecQ